MYGKTDACHDFYANLPMPLFLKLGKTMVLHSEEGRRALSQIRLKSSLLF